MKHIEITNAVTLWETFEKTAHLDDTEYDADLKKSICALIGIKSDKRITESLKRQNISVECLLYAILQATEPFSNMLTDLLKMFECAAAQASNTNLQIKFDFGQGKICPDIDLENFRKTVRSTSPHLLQEHIRIAQDPMALWNIFLHQCGDWTCYPRASSPQITKWLDEYNEDRWPDFFPSAPKSGISALDSIVDMIWGMIQSATVYYRQGYDPEKGRRQSHQEECSRRGNDPVWMMGADSWPSIINIMGGILECKYIRNIDHLSDKVRTEEAALLAQELQDFFDSCAMSQKEIIEAVESLEDILNLPYWERRYELYSAWILTQITKGLHDTGIEYNVPDGVLSFSFRPTLLATCKNLRPPLEIWAELRTECTVPMKGIGRKKHIQPDYSLAIDEAKEPQNTVAVIECKQYKRSNNRNFRAATCDYAAGRPKASVFLVNYGPISKKLLNGGTQGSKGGPFFYQYVRPHSTSSDKFREKLKAEIYEYYRKQADVDPRFLYPWSDPSTTCKIKLTWGQVPEDLDLWFHFDSRNGSRSAICFRWLHVGAKNKRYSVIGFRTPGEQELFDSLDCNCQVGSVQEEIELGHWPDIGGNIIIDNFSGEKGMDNDIELYLSCGEDKYPLICPKAWIRPFTWHAIHFEPLGFQVINRHL